jgi:hypothetical protein
MHAMLIQMSVRRRREFAGRHSMNYLGGCPHKIPLWNSCMPLSWVSHDLGVLPLTPNSDMDILKGEVHHVMQKIIVGGGMLNAHGRHHKPKEKFSAFLQSVEWPGSIGRIPNKVYILTYFVGLMTLICLGMRRNIEGRPMAEPCQCLACSALLCMANQ